MYSIFIGSLLLSLFHAVIPNHWLPVLAIGKKDNWTLQEVTRVTFISGLAHALSTVAIGIILGVLGLQLANKIEYFTHFIAPAVFILSGSFFIYQHHRHKHFHLHKTPRPTLPKNKIILALVVAMFLSPCMEIEAYFLLAGAKGIWAVIGIAALYLTISVSGMVLWVRLAYKGILKLNWHTLEHKSGIITGWTFSYRACFKIVDLLPIGFPSKNLPLPFCLAKQRFISSILLCAFAVLFAHSIVPHNHHGEANTTHQSSHHDDDHDDLNNNFLGQAFSHFQHESNGGITYQTASPTFQCSKFSIDKETILFTQYVIRQLFKPPIIHRQHSSFAFTPSTYSASSLFRGPPMA